MTKNIIIALLAVVATLSVAVGVAQQGRTADIEVRVWQSISDSENLHISARPAGGSWSDLGTLPLDMSGISGSGRYRYGDITVSVSLPEAPAPPTPMPTPVVVNETAEADADQDGLPDEGTATPTETATYSTCAEANNAGLSALTREEVERYGIGTRDADGDGLFCEDGDSPTPTPVPATHLVPSHEAPAGTTTPTASPTQTLTWETYHDCLLDKGLRVYNYGQRDSGIGGGGSVERANRILAECKHLKP